MAFTVCAEPALAARSYLNCQTKKAIIIDAPNGKSSFSTEENVGFWIDEAAETITLADGTPLIVRRFNDRWIGAARDDVSYELIVKMATWLTQARPRRMALQLL